MVFSRVRRVPPQANRHAAKGLLPLVLSNWIGLVSFPCLASQFPGFPFQQFSGVKKLPKADDGLWIGFGFRCLQ